MTWEMLQLAALPGFPLWEKDVHDVLAANLESLQSIFRAYAAAGGPGAAPAPRVVDGVQRRGGKDARGGTVKPGVSAAVDPGKREK